MNYHSDKWIMDRVKEHYEEALEYFPEDRIVGIFYQGSGNYGLDYENSDVDTKLIVIPSVEDIIFNKKPVSTTHVRSNGEHIDFKDVRLMFGTFRKQNLNFVEILFTKYCIVNPEYKEYWDVLVNNNEKIAHYNMYSAIKAMKGIAMEKYHAMEHRYPSKTEIIDKFGYDPKQLHHLLRVYEYLLRYINGESYSDCLISLNTKYLKDVKKGLYSLDDARHIANNIMRYIDVMCSDITSDSTYNTCDSFVDDLLDNIQVYIVKKSIAKELHDI